MLFVFYRFFLYAMLCNFVCFICMIMKVIVFNIGLGPDFYAVS